MSWECVCSEGEHRPGRYRFCPYCGRSREEAERDQRARVWVERDFRMTLYPTDTSGSETYCRYTLRNEPPEERILLAVSVSGLETVDETYRSYLSLQVWVEGQLEWSVNGAALPERAPITLMRPIRISGWRFVEIDLTWPSYRGRYSAYRGDKPVPLVWQTLHREMVR